MSGRLSRAEPRRTVAIGYRVNRDTDRPRACFGQVLTRIRHRPVVVRPRSGAVTNEVINPGPLGFLGNMPVSPGRYSSPYSPCSLACLLVQFSNWP
jgi:hypothetical protein